MEGRAHSCKPGSQDVNVEKKLRGAKREGVGEALGREMGTGELGRWDS